MSIKLEITGTLPDEVVEYLDRVSLVETIVPPLHRKTCRVNENGKHVLELKEVEYHETTDKDLDDVCTVTMACRCGLFIQDPVWVKKKPPHTEAVFK